MQDYFDEEYDDKCFGPDYDYGDSIQFANPGSNSALRAATASNPRTHPCPTCHTENVLTQEDVNMGYQCDICADKAERGYDY